MRLVPVYVSDGAPPGPLGRARFEAAVLRMLDELERKAQHATDVRMARYARILGWRWS